MEAVRGRFSCEIPGCQEKEHATALRSGVPSDGEDLDGCAGQREGEERRKIEEKQEGVGAGPGGNGWGGQGGRR